MRWLLRIWPYGVPTAGLALACVIFLHGPTEDWLKVVTISIIVPSTVAINWRAWKLEQKHGFDAFPDRFHLVFFAVCASFLVFLIFVGFKGNLSKMTGIVGLMGITSGTPLAGCRAFAKQRKTVA